MKRLLIILALILLPSLACAGVQDALKGVIARKNATPSYLFSDGFETNDFSLWDSTTTDSGDLAVDSAQKNSGTYSMLVTHDDNAVIYASKDIGSNVANDDLWVHFYIRFNEISNADISTFDTEQVIQIFATGGSTAYAGIGFQVNSASPRAIATARMYYMNSAPTYTSNGGAWVPSAGTWYEVKARWVAKTDGTGITTIWIDGAQIYTNATLTYTSAAHFGKYRLGCVTAAWAAWTSQYWHIDDFQTAGSDIW